MIPVKKEDIIKSFSMPEQRQIETFFEFRLLAEKGYGVKKISELLWVSVNTLNNWKYRGKMPFCVKQIQKLEKLGFLPFKLDYNDKKIRTILKVGFFTYGDGHIARNHWKMVNLYGRHKDLEKLHRELGALGINCHLKKEKGCSTLHIFDFVGRLLIALGFPEGDKVNSAIALPKWLLNGSRKIKRLFLSIFFGNEGGISNEQKIRISINKTVPFLKTGVKFMRDIKKLCGEFHISTTKLTVRKCGKRKSGEETYSIRFSITERLSVTLFYRKLNFMYADDKQTLLRNVFKNIVHDYLSKCRKRILAYENALELRKASKSIATIARELGIADSTTQAWCRGTFKPDYVEKKEELSSVLNRIGENNGYPSGIRSMERPLVHLPE